METVIRSVRISSTKVRVGDSPRVESPEKVVPEPAVVDAAAVRREAEAAVRRELASEAQRVLEEHRRKGYEEGRQAGIAAGEKEVLARADTSRQEVHQHLEKLSRALSQELSGALRQLQDDSTEIAFAAVCRILGDRAVSREAIEGCVSQQIAAHPGTARLVIRLHPSDAQMLTLSGVQRQFTTAELDIRPDPSLVSGGCVIETDHGQYDATLETQLRKFRALLDEHRSTRSHDERG